jgi:hypothetical protein
MVTHSALLMIRSLAHRGHSDGTGLHSRLVVSRLREMEVFPKVVSREVKAHTYAKNSPLCRMSKLPHAVPHEGLWLDLQQWSVH